MSFHDNSVSLPGDGRVNNIQPGEMVNFLSDNQTNVLFYKKSVHDPMLSKEHGRPMSRGIEYVRIQQPGEKDYTDDPVVNKPWAPQRFPRQWAQYQRSQTQIPDGTPVECLFPQHLEIAANLHSYAIHTIEQLANLQDSATQSIGMGATQMRDKARKFLEASNKGVGIHKLEAELAKRDNQIEVMTNQMAQMKATIDKLVAEKQGVPGAMIPSAPMPAAQGHAMSVPAASDWTVPAPPADARAWPEDGDESGEEPEAGVSGPTITNDPQKARGGRPRGSKNKPRDLNH